MQIPDIYFVTTPIDSILAAAEGGTNYLLIIIAIIAGAAITWILQTVLGKSQIQNAKQQAQLIAEDAKLKAENITKTAQLDSKAELIKKREEFEQETAKIGRAHV